MTDQPITTDQLKELRDAARKAQSAYAHALRAHKKQRRAANQEATK